MKNVAKRKKKIRTKRPVITVMDNITDTTEDAAVIKDAHVDATALAEDNVLVAITDTIVPAAVKGDVLPGENSPLKRKKEKN